MIPPAIPENEAQRLQTLRSLEVLDTPPEERFDRLTRLAMRLFKVPVAQVSLVDESRQWFKSCLGIDPVEVPREHTFCGHTILGDGPFVIPDTTKDERFVDNPYVINEPYVRFYAGYPLEINKSKVGTICVLDRVSREFSGEDESTLQDLAMMAQQELYALQMATMDQLTDLTNRRGFLSLAKNALKFCLREDIPATMVYFDLNGFKAINDQYGHAEGDRALVAFSDLLKTTLRESDILARIGGDEFVAFLVDTEGDVARAVLGRLQKALSEHNSSAEEPYSIHYSAGVLSFQPTTEHTIEGLLSEADALMYAGKQNGAH